jgi:hypothetical protein
MNQSASKSFLASIRDNIKDVWFDFWDNLIDNLDVFDSNIIESIPIIKGIFGIYNSYISISDKIYIKKILKFYQSIDCTEEERKNFVEEERTNWNFDEVVEVILTNIQKCESTKKITIIGRIFSDFIKGKLSQLEFEDLSHIITNCRLSSLEYMPYDWKDNDMIRESHLPEWQIDLVFLWLLREDTYLEIREDEEDFQTAKHDVEYIKEMTKKGYSLTHYWRLLMKYL